MKKHIDEIQNKTNAHEITHEETMADLNTHVNKHIFFSTTRRLMNNEPMLAHVFYGDYIPGWYHVLGTPFTDDDYMEIHSETGDVRRLMNGQWKDVHPFMGESFLIKDVEANIMRESRYRMLLASVFPDVKIGETVDHIDGNRTNNKVSNLRWMKHRHNCSKSNIDDDGEKKRMSRVTLPRVSLTTPSGTHYFTTVGDARMVYQRVYHRKNASKMFAPNDARSHVEICEGTHFDLLSRFNVLEDEVWIDHVQQSVKEKAFHEAKGTTAMSDVGQVLSTRSRASGQTYGPVDRRTGVYGSPIQGLYSRSEALMALSHGLTPLMLDRVIDNNSKCWFVSCKSLCPMGPDEDINLATLSSIFVMPSMTGLVDKFHKGTRSVIALTQEEVNEVLTNDTLAKAVVIGDKRNEMSFTDEQRTHAANVIKKLREEKFPGMVDSIDARQDMLERMYKYKTVDEFAKAELFTPEQWQRGLQEKARLERGIANFVAEVEARPLYDMTELHAQEEVLKAARKASREAANALKQAMGKRKRDDDENDGGAVSGKKPKA
jgi:hypothetical protein